MTLHVACLKPNEIDPEKIAHFLYLGIVASLARHPHGHNDWVTVARLHKRYCYEKDGRAGECLPLCTA